MKLIDIARVCYDTNRAVCIVSGEAAYPTSWETAAHEIKDVYLKAVEERIANPMAPASLFHDRWLCIRREEGWVHGPVLNEETREDPNLVPYMALPLAQRLKDTLFKNTVVALAPLHFAAKSEEERLAPGVQAA